ncbi:hypothetical protein [Patulibacter sp. SYSU D01012]|uniref:hypothetical protein n=1 Tax=Patulibacter sp. SYSU D01012 TaxID=2817381 RepID=UPI001B3155BA|nr:hypothetical protein [Patulibacter sp. SYSU D01012]
MRVEDQAGRTWRVRRRWLPWRRRIREVPDVGPDVSLGDDPISIIIGLFLLILAIPALIVLTVLLAELVLLVVLLPVVVLLRLAAGWLGFGWTIEVWARPRDRRWFGWELDREEHVKGWARSRDRIRALADELRAGRP